MLSFRSGKDLLKKCDCSFMVVLFIGDSLFNLVSQLFSQLNHLNFYEFIEVTHFFLFRNYRLLQLFDANMVICTFGVQVYNHFLLRLNFINEFDLLSK
jgi:hypothetical protein